MSLDLVGIDKETLREEKTPDYIRTDFFRGKFSVSQDPLVGKTVVLTFTVHPIQEAPNTIVKLILPFGIETSAKSLTWSADIAKDKQAQFEIPIRVIESGEWRIQAYVKSVSANGHKITQSYYIYIVATSTTGYISKRATRTGVAGEQILNSMKQRSFPQQSSLGWSSSNMQAPSETPGFITVSGRWEYQDEAGNWKPIRFAKVELYDAEVGPDELVTPAVKTDKDGKYSFHVDNDDGPLQDGRDIYVKIYCESDAAKVTDGNLANIPYWSVTDTHSDVPDGPIAMGTAQLPYDNYQALDYIIDEYQWFRNRVGWTRSQVLVRWPYEDWPHSHGDTIDLPDKGIWSWNRSTILHEYAHSIMWSAYGDSFPPGAGGHHAIWSEHIVVNDQVVDSNSGFAFIEGWAEFMQSTIDNDPENTGAYSPQGDLDGDGTPGTATWVYNPQTDQWEIEWADPDDPRWKNIEENEWWKGEDFDGSNNSGAIVEGAVASILWDIFDSSPSDDDELQMGIEEIWSIILNDNPNNIVEFWRDWHFGYTEKLRAIYYDHGINPATIIYVPDGYSTIQEAVNAASSGDTIIVRDGTYTENVNVDKSNLTIKSENGAEVTTVQAANPHENVFEIWADSVTIKGFTAKGATRGSGTLEKAGIWLAYANYCTISNNNVMENDYGIALGSSHDVSILNNYAHDNNHFGIYLNPGNNNEIKNNTGSNNGYGGIVLSGSSNNNITKNDVSNNPGGIELVSSSDNNLIENNTASNNTGGIYLNSSSNNTVTNNLLENTGIVILGNELPHFNTHIIEGNTVNGKPIYYYKDTDGVTVPEDAGEVIITNCTNMKVKDIDASNGTGGIEIAYTTDSLILNNTINSNHYDGIRLHVSSNNTIMENTISNNHPGGIYLHRSNDNQIYFNSFLNNESNIRPFNSTNTWNSPEQITYTYNGTTYTNYLGNYWDDYIGSDADGDGIGDTSYSINSDNDDYPLMEPFENYAGDTEAVFRVTKEGNVYADAAYYGADFLSGGADIAEHIKVSEPVEPGDVVALDPDNPSYYRKSRKPYSTLASGVISTQPGFTLGIDKSHWNNQIINLIPLFEQHLVLEDVSLADLSELPADYTDTCLEMGFTLETITPKRISQGQISLPTLNLTSLEELLFQEHIEQTLTGKPLLALMGVVPVKAITENGPIKPGDLLTTSSISGHVMRCEDKKKCMGAIIGKALEPLEKGTGIIKMLVMR